MAEIVHDQRNRSCDIKGGFLSDADHTKIVPVYILLLRGVPYVQRQMHKGEEIMIGGDNGGFCRRELLRGSLISGSLLIFGFDKLLFAKPFPWANSDAFRSGTLLGVVDFSDEGYLPMDQALGKELDGRLFMDLSKLTAEHPVTPTSSFYVRTRASKLLASTQPWSIQFSGLTDKPSALAVTELNKMARPMGLHLMECAGNLRSGISE